MAESKKANCGRLPLIDCELCAETVAARRVYRTTCRGCAERVLRHLHGGDAAPASMGTPQ